MENVLLIEIEKCFDEMAELRTEMEFESVIMLAIETEKKANLAYEQGLYTKGLYLEAIGCLGHIKDSCYCLYYDTIKDKDVNEN